MDTGKIVEKPPNSKVCLAIPIRFQPVTVPTQVIPTWACRKNNGPEQGCSCARLASCPSFRGVVRRSAFFPSCRLLPKAGCLLLSTPCPIKTLVYTITYRLIDIR
jgi:hypothetical protein